MSEDENVSAKAKAVKIRVKSEKRSFTAPVISKKQFTEMVDEVLESNGVPRRCLYEYPYNEFESVRLIKNAEKTVEKIAEILKMRIEK